MTTVTQVNSHLTKKGIDGYLVNGKGYFYFSGGLLDRVPTIYANSLQGYTLEEIMGMVEGARPAVSPWESAFNKLYLVNLLSGTKYNSYHDAAVCQPAWAAMIKKLSPYEIKNLIDTIEAKM